MAKQEVKNAVAVKKAAPMPAPYVERRSVVDASDIVVPKLLLAQGLSVAVAEGKAKMGDITNSLTGVVIGGPTKEISFIPVTLKKYWKRFEQINGKKQYRGSEPFSRENAQRPLKARMPSQMNPAQESDWEFDLVIDLYGFTDDDAQDPIALPTAISFTRTSYKAGQQVNTLLASLEAVNLPYYTHLMSVTCAKKQNDKGIFYTFDVKPKMDGAKMAKTPTEYFPKIERWSQILTDSSRNVVVDDSDEVVESGPAPLDEDKF